MTAPATSLVHLDAAGCARSSPATIAAQVAHLEREALLGGYVAEAEAAPTLARARQRLGRLFGQEGSDVAFVENATRAFSSVLAAWPFRSGDRVGIVASEYGSNRMALDALAERKGIALVELSADTDGRIRMEDLKSALPGLALVTFPVVASHRGVVQPAHEIAVLCRSFGVPAVLDVAQAAGHVDLTGCGADVYVGTARKWLRGPRGVGFVVVGPVWADRLVPPVPELHTAVWSDSRPRPLGGAPRFGIGEAPVAARVGLAVALEELAEAGPSAVAATLADRGRAARARLAELAGWRVREPADEASALVTLSHDHVAAENAQQSLFERGILSAVVPRARAPHDLDQAVLRVSFHTYNDGHDLDRLEQALTTL